MIKKSYKHVIFSFVVALFLAIISVPIFAFAQSAFNSGADSTQAKSGEPAAAPSADMSNYLCFTPAGNSATFQFYNAGSSKTINTVYYSDNVGATWEELVIGTPVTISGPIYIKSSNPEGFNDDFNDNYRFSIDSNNKIFASGSVMSLIDNGEGSMSSISSIQYCFNSLFSDCEGLLSPPVLPATTLSYCCYEYMFSGCTNLNAAPELPALEICEGAYDSMFEGCSALEYPPALPATHLGEWCYEDMFRNCTSLKVAPELPATNLTSECYEYMFRNCDALVKAPYLPAEQLAPECYKLMFQGCDKLNEVSVSFTSWDDVNESTNDWLGEVPSSGTFICPIALPTSPRDSNHIPENWTVQYFVSAKVDGYNNVYDGQEHGLTITPQDPAEITKEYSWDGSSWSTEPIAEKNVGEYKVYYKLSAENYVSFEGSAMIIITPKTDASASFIGAPYTKMYGDKDPIMQINFVGFLEGDDPRENIDYAISRQIGEDVNPSGENYKVTLNWFNENYSVESTETTLTITKTNKYKLVCDSVSKVDYEPDPTNFTAHMEGLKFDDELLSTDYDIQKIPSNENPSVITLVPSFSDSVSDRIKNNYIIENVPACFVNGTYKIYESPETPEFRFEVDSYDSYYDGQEHEFIINVKNPASGALVQYKKEGDTEWQNDPYSFKDAGEYNIAYKITYTGFADLEDSATLNIKKAPILIEANYKEIYDGQGVPIKDATVTGLIEGEQLADTDYTLKYNPETISGPGTYAIEVSLNLTSNVGKNYEGTAVNSKLVVKEKKKTDFVSEPYFGIYDGQAHSIFVDVNTPAEYTIEYSTDGETFDTQNPEFTDVTAVPEVVYFKITPQDITYEVIEAAETVSIQKASATIVADAAYKTEGEADPEFSAKTFGLIGDEEFVLGEDYKLVRDSGEAPGVYEINCILADSEVVNNYDIETANSKFFIVAAPSDNPTVINGNDGNTTSATGDNTFIIFVILSSLIVLCGVTLIARKSIK